MLLVGFILLRKSIVVLDTVLKYLKKRSTMSRIVMLVVMAWLRISRNTPVLVWSSSI